MSSKTTVPESYFIIHQRSYFIRLGQQVSYSFTAVLHFIISPSPLELFNWHRSTLQHLGSSDFEWIYFGLDLVQIMLELVPKEPMASLYDGTEQS